MAAQNRRDRRGKPKPERHHRHQFLRLGVFEQVTNHGPADHHPCADGGTLQCAEENKLPDAL